MNKYLKENENDSIKNIFDKRQVYKILTKSEYPNLVDFAYAEKALYGRVNRYMIPITPNEQFLQMKYLQTTGPTQVQVFNFVADAFSMLQNKFRQKVLMNQIRDDDQYLSELVPTKGYQDPNQLYLNYRQAFSSAVGNVILKNGISFTNFEEFMNVMMPYIENSLKTKSFTYPAYVKSKDCPISISGLAIEIGGHIDSNDDKFKYENFYESPNWEFFLNACNTYGFMVDLNMPNRIVADIRSEIMVEKMAAYNTGVDSTDSLIHNCYEPAYTDYYATFKRFFYDIYSDNKKRTIVTTAENKNDGTQSVIHRVKSYSYEEFKEQYDDSYFLGLYCKIRFLEEESQFREDEKHSLTRNTKELARLDLSIAIESFEKILNKTFDYDGSLSYILKRNAELEK